MKKGLLIAMLSLGTLAVGGGITYACVSAGKQNQEAEVSEVVEAQEEEQSAEIDELEKWAKEKWDTYVSPLLGGVSITAVITFVTTIAVNYFKNKKINASVEELKSLVSQVIGLVLTVNRINESVANSEGIASETKEYVTAKCEEISKLIGKSSKQLDAVEDIKPLIRLLVQLQTKLAESSDAMANKEIADDVREIKALVENF